MVKKENTNSIYKQILHFLYSYYKENKSLFIILGCYSILMISIIDWGIPNNKHPFTYHMDEWHQLQAVKNTFKHLTPNIEGSAHGTLFHFFLSGVYLIPFYLFGIIDPFVIKSGLTAISMQAKLFEILRLNTILFGCLSLFVLNGIIKKFFKINPTATFILFIFTPVWIYLSNYFKYDIALTFWILLSIFFLLKFGSNPTLKNYVVAGIACALALAVKLSALPLLLIYIFSFFYFTDSKKIAYHNFLIGILVFIGVFLIAGIPDILLGKANYSDFLASNLSGLSSVSNNFLLTYRPWWVYTFLVVMPVNFGRAFFIVFLLSVIYWTVVSLKKICIKDVSSIKNEFFILISFFIFVLSLWQLQTGANGNRLLVLLPFLAILSGSFLHAIKFYKFSLWRKRTMIILLSSVLVLQLIESCAIIYIKNETDVRQLSSIWLTNNIKRESIIGVENIPIYQLLPDIIVKEFYGKQENPELETYFNVKVIDVSTKKLPDIIIISNREFEGKYLKKSAKKNLLQKMNQEKYILKKEFKPPQILYLLMKNELHMNTSGLVPIPTISIYVKQS